jgi:hypothetical protein
MCNTVHCTWRHSGPGVWHELCWHGVGRKAAGRGPCRRGLLQRPLAAVTAIDTVVVEDNDDDGQRVPAPPRAWLPYHIQHYPTLLTQDRSPRAVP